MEWSRQAVCAKAIYTSYSLLSVLCIWATKSCFCSSCSFVSISNSLGRLQRRTGSSLGKDKRNRRVRVNVEKEKVRMPQHMHVQLWISFFFFEGKWHWRGFSGATKQEQESPWKDRLCQCSNGTNRFLCHICSHYWLIGRVTGTKEFRNHWTVELIRVLLSQPPECQ